MSPGTPMAVVVLLQWTLLVAFGWTLHAVCYRRHPLWRVVLWRAVLSCGLLLPFAFVVPIPRFTVTAPQLLQASLVSNSQTVQLTSEQSGVVGAAISRRTDDPIQTRVVAGGRENALQTHIDVAAPASFPWVLSLVVVWAVGTMWNLLRLFLLSFRLRFMTRTAEPAAPALEAMVTQTRVAFGSRRRIAVRVSSNVESPFLCGLFRPTLLLPKRLLADLPPAELKALLCHEVAHHHRGDLFWCLGWEVMKALNWFHPLVWRVPAAHALATEEEADRLAACRVQEEASYAALLARVVLRLVDEGRPGEPVALHATSHIRRRLEQLGRAYSNWRLRHTAIAAFLVTFILVVAAGWEFGREPAILDTSSRTVEWATVSVSIQSDEGQPLEGASVLVTGLQTISPTLTAKDYGWAENRFGPLVSAIANSSGMAHVRYPRFILPERRVLTERISILVRHPNFAASRTECPIDGSGAPVLLKRGIPITVSGAFGPQRERVDDTIPILIGRTESVRPEEWLRDDAGRFTWNGLSAEKYILLLMGRLSSGEVVYSSPRVFFGEQRESQIHELELKPGVRVQGKLDASVPRPVKNGWVQLSVHVNDGSSGDFRRYFGRRPFYTGFWWSYRPIAADGTFVFNSVPEGRLHVVANGDGFVSALRKSEAAPSGNVSPLARATRSVAQQFAFERPVTYMEIATEPTSTLRNVTRDGKPAANSGVPVWPDVIEMPIGTRLFTCTLRSSEAPFVSLPPLPQPRYSALAR